MLDEFATIFLDYDVYFRLEKINNLIVKDEQAMEFEVQSPGCAHVYTVEQSPINPDLILAGTATAGLWKSVDKGLNWTLMTRDLEVTGVYSIALDPIDANIIYFGERNGMIWKSIDGGSNFQANNQFTGLDASDNPYEIRVRNGNGTCFVEIVSNCPSNWKMTPLESNHWLDD